MGLPEGVYLLSNVLEAPSQPMLVETAAPIREPDSQWQPTVAARANHRHCHVFKDPADLLDFSLEAPYACERN